MHKSELKKLHYKKKKQMLKIEVQQQTVESIIPAYIQLNLLIYLTCQCTHFQYISYSFFQ